METIAIVNRKGGAGKTVTAWTLGAGLMKKRKKVLFVDLDSQQNLSYDIMADTSGLTAIDMLTGEASAEEIIQRTQNGDIIPAGATLAGADIMLTDNGREYRLKEALQPLAGQYDYVILDTPPALGTITTNALTAANAVIIPAQAEVHSLQGIGLLADTIATIRKHTSNKNLYIDGILLTRYNARAVLSRDMRDNLADIASALHTRLYTDPIRECIAVKEAEALQTDIFKYAPKSNAAKDYSNFIKEFMKGR